LHEFIESNSNSNEYIVEKVLNVRTKAGRREYEVKWEGWSETTWVPVNNLANNERLHEFKRRAVSTAR
jgi:hypothetical protein